MTAKRVILFQRDCPFCGAPLKVLVERHDWRPRDVRSNKEIPAVRTKCSTPECEGELVALGNEVSW